MALGLGHTHPVSTPTTKSLQGFYTAHLKLYFTIQHLITGLQPTLLLKCF